MKVFHSRLTNRFYKNRIGAIDAVAQNYYSDNRLRGPDKARMTLINEVDIGILQKQEIVDLLNRESYALVNSIMMDSDKVETVAKIWLEGKVGDVTVVCREKAQTGIVYRNIKVEEK